MQFAIRHDLFDRIALGPGNASLFGELTPIGGAGELVSKEVPHLFFACIGTKRIEGCSLRTRHLCEDSRASNVVLPVVGEGARLTSNGSRVFTGGHTGPCDGRPGIRADA